MESFETSRKQERIPTDLEVKMEIQSELIKQTAEPGEDINARAMKWATGPEAVKFAGAFNEMKAEHPDIGREWLDHKEELIKEAYHRVKQDRAA